MPDPRARSERDPLADAQAARRVLTENANATELRGRPTPESRAAIWTAGGFALTTPASFGGVGAELPTTVSVLAEFARGCPASAWVAAVSAAIKRLITPWLSTDALGSLFADPDVQVVEAGAPGRARTDGGGLRISGRWPYASGCEDAAWACLMVILFEDGRVVGPRLTLLATSDLSIERTWDVAGLQGTGSHTLVAEELAVPGWGVIDLPLRSDGTPDAEILGVPLLASAVTIGSPLLGMAQGALDVVEAMFSGDRVPPAQTRYARMSDSPLARQWYVQASRRVAAAQRTWRDVAAAVEAASSSGSMERSERLRLRLELAETLRDLRQATDRLCDLHGSSGFAKSNPLQRFWRDLAVGSRHAAFTPYLIAEDYGRLLFTDETPALGLA